MIRTFFALALTVVSTAVLAECKTELKSTDRYPELSAILKCLNDEIGRLKAVPGTAPAGKGEPLRPPPLAPAGSHKAEVGKNTVYLTGCSLDKTKRKLTCHLSYVPKEDGTLSFTQVRTYYHDNNGDKHSCTSINGRNIDDGPVSSYQKIISGVSYNAELEFEPAKDEVQWIALLRLELGDGRSSTTFEWRQMPVSN